MTEYASKESPYVLSQDVGLLFNEWGGSNNLRIPSKDFFNFHTDQLAQKLETIVGDVDLVLDQELIQGMQYLLDKSSLPTISLDRVYSPSFGNIFSYIDSTRVVDENLNSIGVYNRDGIDDVEEQVHKISSQLHSFGLDRVQLWDDVIFHGGSLSNLINLFNETGTSVDRVVCGIGVGQGMEEINKLGVAVDSVRTYDELYDEVCERDFVPGTNYGGRLVVNQNTGTVLRAPYILPFGDAVSWGSIPEESSTEFSSFCLEQSLIIWTEVNSLNEIEIQSNQLPQRIVGMPERVSIVKFLEEKLKCQTMKVAP